MRGLREVRLHHLGWVCPNKSMSFCTKKEYFSRPNGQFLCRKNWFQTRPNEAMKLSRSPRSTLDQSATAPTLCPNQLIRRLTTQAIFAYKLLNWKSWIIRKAIRQLELCLTGQSFEQPNEYQNNWAHQWSQTQPTKVIKTNLFLCSCFVKQAFL